VRAGAPSPGRPPTSREVPSQDVVPGDVLQLGPGDLVPADACLLAARDLVVDQSTLFRESLPVPKQPAGLHHPEGPERRAARTTTATASATAEVTVTVRVRIVVDSPSLCFAGTSVVSGSATGVVIATGAHTYAGVIARHTRPRRAAGVEFRPRRADGRRDADPVHAGVACPIVLAVNGAVSGDWARPRR